MRIVLLFLVILLLPSVVHSEDVRYEINGKTIFETVLSDYKAFYTQPRLYRAASVFTVGAVMAHSSIDTEFQSWHQSNIRSSTSDDFSAVVKTFGEKSILFPLAGLASTWQFDNKDSKLAHWGQLSMRALLLGGPIIGVTQPLTGGSRPKDQYQNAHWRPLNDDNGVSGHSFVGAIPFLALTKMDTLTEVQKNIAYVASGLAAWSRINDDAHYLSQAMLGWYVAWESLNAISETELATWYQITPYAFGDGAGISIRVNW